MFLKTALGGRYQRVFKIFIWYRMLVLAFSFLLLLEQDRVTGIVSGLRRKLS
jgi:hypothetical protein